MSIDIRHLSDSNVDRLTRLLARRPEYGIAQPSRRWQLRQEMKIRSLPEEMLYTSSFLKRLFIKLADSLSPDVVDPRAVLCKTHAPLNPWLIRRLFMAVAYEVTVHSDTLRSWRGKKDVPDLSAFVGRIDAIAALWTEPELYRQCYGTPPFESHMVFVQSGCEACILAAMGANARALADLRAILLDRVERRQPCRGGRPVQDPRLARYVDSWISHFQEERAATCIDRSDHMLGVLRDVRPQLSGWRRQRRKDSRAPNTTLYTELRRSKGGHQLSTVPNGTYCKRRTRDGVPVAMTDFEDAEERRQAAVYSLQDEESIYRPDSMHPLASTERFAHAGVRVDDPPPPDSPYNLDSYYFENQDEEQELERTLGDEVVDDRRSYVAGWYANQLATSHADLTEDDARSVLSMVHPAFRSASAFTHPSAVPTPLGARERVASRSSVWTDFTVHSEEGSRVHLPVARDAPPIPRIPSEYRNTSTQSGIDNDDNDDGDFSPARANWPTTSRPSRPTRPRQNSAPSVSSAYLSTDQLPLSPQTRDRDPSRTRKPPGPPPAFLNSHHAGRFLSANPSERSLRPPSARPMSSRSTLERPSSSSTNPYLRNLREYAAGGNPYSSRVPSVRSGVHSAPASEAGSGSGSERGGGRRRSRSVRLSDVPSMTSDRSESEYADEPPQTPRTTGSRQNLNEAWRRQLEDEFRDIGDVTPWTSFYRRSDEEK